MLRIKTKAHLGLHLDRLDVGDLYLSPDLSFISGTTLYGNDISDGDNVSIATPYFKNKITIPIHLKKVKRTGYVIANEKLPIKTTTIYDSDDNSLTDINYVFYKGNYYYVYSNGSLTGVLIDGFFYRIGSDGNITVPTKHWIENGNVNIDGTIYHVDMDLTENSLYNGGYEMPTLRNALTDEVLTQYNGSDIIVCDYTSDKWYNTWNFRVNDNLSYNINIESGECANFYPFVIYNGNEYAFDNITVSGSTNYGTLINNQFIEISGVSSLYDFDYVDSPEVAMNGEVISVNSTLKSSVIGMHIILHSELDNIIDGGDVIIAESDDKSHGEIVRETSNGDKYVVYDGNCYRVKKNVCDYILLNEEQIPITYTDDDKTTGYLTINSQSIPVAVVINDNKKQCRITNSVYIKNSDGSTDYKSQEPNEWYDVIERDGIEYKDGVNFPVYKAYNDSGGTDDTYVCIMDTPKKYYLQVNGVEGTSAIICTPLIYFISGNPDIYEVMSINRDIISNLQHFRFYNTKSIFGNGIIKDNSGALLSLSANYPISSKDYNLTLSKIEIYKIHNYITVPLALGNDVDPSVMRDDIIENEFVKDKTNESVNHIVDMEKDVYYPARQGVGDKFIPITEIHFNLHFRTRNLDSWKIIEDDSQDYGSNKLKTTTSGICNWFVTDYYPYKDILGSVKAAKIQNNGDLIGLLNFTDDDIRYRKKKISKSFLRLSFYSTPNPQTQVLLSTSTIFMDENILFKKYINGVINDDGIYKGITLNEKSFKDSGNTIPIGITSEEVKQTSNGYELVIDSNKRLDSNIVITDKYSTTTSSEGFYLYLFKDYSTELREGTIYLKVDFCHAGIGSVIPFIIPIKDNRPLYLTDKNDVEVLKEGIPLTEIYNNMYIPIKIKYSENDRKYYYYLPENYIENYQLNWVDENIMMFNLFEIKIKNQSNG